MQVAIVAVVLATGGYLLAPFVTLARLEAHSDCSLRQAIRTVWNFWTPNPADRIGKASRVIQTDDAAGLVLMDTPQGRFWVPKGTESSLVVFLGQQEAKIYGAGARGVHAGDIVLDCGANVGDYTRDALRAGAAMVVAIEPAPDNVECLRRNFVEEIRAGKVVVFPKGVWNQNDFLTLYTFPHNSGADSFVINGPARHNEIKVPLTTIDQLVAELRLPRVDFIKIDIKGAAPQALTGARQTLTAFHPRLAISTEEPLDYPNKIRAPILAGWSGYRTECGFCQIFKEGFIPEVMFYY